MRGGGSDEWCIVAPHTSLSHPLSPPAANDARPTALRPNFAFAVIVFAASAIVWTERSRYLISWDAGNFALALGGIDIAAHRPHPPGYVGYVLAGRLMHRLVPSANDAFVLWNIVAMMIASVALLRLPGRHRVDVRPLPRDDARVGRVVAVAAMLCSPLLLFYAGSAEIYTSELAVVLTIAGAALAVIRGTASPLLMFAAFVVGALFKLSSALFMLPVIAYAVWAAPLTREGRRHACELAVASLAVVAAVFLALERSLLSIVWSQFLDVTSQSRVVGAGTSSPARLLNRNARDALVALLSAAGFNVIGLLGWLLQSRAASVDRRVLWLWLLPWCVVLSLLHVGKPGYVLPIFPVFALAAGEWYARLGTRGLVLAGVACLANVVWFVFAPPSSAALDTRPYQDKPLLSRIASDLAPVTFPTVNTLRQNDREVADTLAAAASCGSGSWVVVAGSYRADWRRMMYYLPHATAVRQTDEGTFQFIGRNGMFTAIAGSERLSSGCGLLWTSTRPPASTGNATPMALRSGWRLGPGSGAVSPTELRWTVSSPSPDRAGPPDHLTPP